MEQKEITCIICPVGCAIIVQGQGAQIDSIEGFACKRGEIYARDEFIHPMRILTSTLHVDGVGLVAVRSSELIPKELQLQCMDVIRSAKVQRPVARYDVLIANILDTGADMVATGTVD